MIAMRPLALLAAASLFAACTMHVDFVGSGIRRSEPRTVAPFQKVHVRGAATVVAEIGERTEVEVTADDNLLPRFDTRVEGDTLILELQPGSYSYAEAPRVRLVTPALKSFEVEGSSAATLQGLRGERFVVHISGSGDVRCQGAVAELSVRIEGSGRIAARELAAQRAKVELAGSGDIHVAASEDLDVSLEGSGRVVYQGRPRLHQRIAGSGEIRGG